MKLVFEKTQCNQRVHIEKISHGRSDRISRTCSLVNCGAPGPALRTGRPVITSRPIAAFAGREWRGVRTICPLFTLASRGSPGRSPSFRRMAAGRTTCPLLEMRVCIVRISYRTRALGHKNGSGGPRFCIAPRTLFGVGPPTLVRVPAPFRSQQRTLCVSLTALHPASGVTHS
jgi:hypothetical protein